MAVKLSELRQGAMINNDGEVMMKEQVVEMIQEGKTIQQLWTVSEKWIQDALKDAFNDHSEGEGSNEYTAADPDAELIEIDL